jgi:DNA-binding SARP family transcriptional activator
MQPTVEASENIVRLLAQSNECEEKGELRTAIAYAQQAFAEIQPANVVLFNPGTLARLARLHTRAGQYTDGRRYALEVLENYPESEEHADALISLGICNAETRDSDAAEEYFHRAADISRGLNHKHLLGRALHNLASTVYFPRGQFDLALTVMQEAQLFRSEADQRHWGLPFLQAMIYELTGNRHRARQALDELLPILQPSSPITGGYFYLWARLAMAEGEFDRAQEYLHLLMRIATTTGVPDLNIWARIEFARCKRLQGNAADARAWAEDGVKYAQRIDDEYLTAQAMLELAHCAWHLQNAAVARGNLSAAQAIFERRRARYDLAYAGLLDATWAQQERRPDAEAIWQKAAEAILDGGYSFLLEREREMAFPLIAAHLRGSPPARKAAESMLRSLEQVAPPPLRIHTLGNFAVWQGRRRIGDSAWQRRKAGELFRFLLLQPGFRAGRETILEALWPEHDAQPAVDLLHQSTSTLRHILEPDLPDKFPSRYLMVEGECVTLKLPDGCQIDCLEFEQQIISAMTTSRIDLLQAALQIYQGSLFPSDQYNDWSALRRERLSDLYRRGTQTLGQLYLDRQQYFDALDCSQAVVRLDPWNEDGVYLGMRACQGLQDAPRALRMFSNLEKILQADLDLAPRSDLRDLAQALRQANLSSTNRPKSGKNDEVCQ